MFSNIRKQLSYSNLMASAAVFIALGGGAYALAIPAASVGTKQLKKRAVTSAKIKKSAVRGGKVRDDSLTGADIAESSLGTVPSASTAGSANTANTANTAKSANKASAADTAAVASSAAAGSIGGAALKESTKVESAGTTVAAGGSAAETAVCPSGTTVIGGGSFWDITQGILNTDGDLLITTHSFRSGNGWIARAGNASGSPRDFHAEAYCLAG
jgi:hypothetical protein